MDSEIKIEMWPQRNPGGQVVGPGPQGIKVSHPIGIEVAVNIARSQFKNKQIAMALLELGIEEAKR